MGAARDEEARGAETRVMGEQVWFTIREAAEYLRTTPSALQSHVYRGTLKPDCHGCRGRTRGHRFSRATLDAFMRGEKAA